MAIIIADIVVSVFGELGTISEIPYISLATNLFHDKSVYFYDYLVSMAGEKIGNFNVNSFLKEYKHEILVLIRTIFLAIISVIKRGVTTIWVRYTAKPNILSALDGQWAWSAHLYSRIQADSKSSGTLSFSKIHDPKFRDANPRGTIVGTTMQRDEKNREQRYNFNATDITTGRPQNGKIYFEWEMIDGTFDRGMTRLQYTVLECSKDLRYYLSRFFLFKIPIDLQLSGVFLTQDHQGHGVIGFGRSLDEAEKTLTKHTSSTGDGVIAHVVGGKGLRGDSGFEPKDGLGPGHRVGRDHHAG